MLETIPLTRCSADMQSLQPIGLSRASPSVRDLLPAELDLFTPSGIGCLSPGQTDSAQLPAAETDKAAADSSVQKQTVKLDSLADPQPAGSPRAEPERSRGDPASVPHCSAAAKAAGKEKTPAGDLENRASQCELAQQDLLRAEEVLIRMSAERRLHAAKIQAMLANLETEIQRIWEEVTLRRQKIHDDLLGKWEKVLFA